MLIRMNENRAMYEMGGWIQWRPTTGKKWYTMHVFAIRPKGMKELFTFKYLDALEDERAVVKIIGWWDRKTKEMVVERIVGYEQT